MKTRLWIICLFLLASLAPAALAQNSGGDLWRSGRHAATPTLPAGPGDRSGVFSLDDNGYIGVYADPAATNSCIQVPPGNITTFYVIATLGGGTSNGLTGAEFRIDANTTGYIMIPSPNPEASISLGDMFAQGANIAFPVCQGSAPGDHVLLYTVVCINAGGGPTDLLVKRRNPPTNPNHPCPLFTLCNPPEFTQVCMATCPEGDLDGVAFKAQLNVPTCTDLGPCPPSVSCPPGSEPCIQLAAQVPDFICEGDDLLTTSSATNCAAVPESIFTYVNGQLVGVFGDVPPGGTVSVQHVLPSPLCLNGEVPVSFMARGVTSGCPPATIVDDRLVACRPRACVGLDVVRAPAEACPGSEITVEVAVSSCSQGPEDVDILIDGVFVTRLFLRPGEAGMLATRTWSTPPTCPAGGRYVFDAVAVATAGGCPDTSIASVSVAVRCDMPQCRPTGPDCSNATATLTELWPPNHQLVAVGISGVTTPDGAPATIEITGVTSDEIVNGLGDGDTCPDAVLGGSTVELRAERSGTGNGRVYTLHFTATDPSGQSCNGSATVCVPHDRAAGHLCVDDGFGYDATTCEIGLPMEEVPRRGLQLAREAGAGIGLTFALEKAGPVELIVFDTAGRALRTLASGPYPAGLHTIRWNGLDASGHAVANGIYFFRLTTEGKTHTAKSVWVR